MTLSLLCFINVWACLMMTIYIVFMDVCVCLRVPAAVLSIIDKIYYQSVSGWIFKAIQLVLGINCGSQITVTDQGVTWEDETDAGI